MPKPRKPQNPSLAISVAAVAVVAGLAIAALTVHHNNAGNGSVAGPYGNNNSSAGNSASKYSTVNPATPGNAVHGSNAASNTQTSGASALYLTPDGSGTLAAGSTLTVTIHENSGTTAVNAVQANLSYPTDKLKFVSANGNSGAFAIAAPTSGGNGKVAIARGSTTPLTGDKAVATVTFTVLPVSGNSSVSFATGTALVTASDHRNIAGSLGGVTYHIQ
jgi:hypothetical protein